MRASVDGVADLSRRPAQPASMMRKCPSARQPPLSSRHRSLTIVMCQVCHCTRHRPHRHHARDIDYQGPRDHRPTRTCLSSTRMIRPDTSCSCQRLRHSRRPVRPSGDCEPRIVGAVRWPDLDSHSESVTPGQTEAQPLLNTSSHTPGSSPSLLSHQCSSGLDWMVSRLAPILGHAGVVWARLSVRSAAV